MPCLISATLSIDFLDVNRVSSILEAGADIIRILYWSPHQNREVVELIRKCSRRLRKPVQILMDLPANKIRLGYFTPKNMYIEEKVEYRLVVGENTNESRTLPVDYPDFLDLCKVGDEIICGDGDVVFRIIDKGVNNATIVSDFPGWISCRRGVYIKGMDASLVSQWSKASLEGLSLCGELSLDWIALSFVNDAGPIITSRRILDELGVSGTKIMAKIESREGLHNLDSIVKHSDGIMVARGDLALYDDYARLAINQKRIIYICKKYNKFCMVSTGMLESLMRKPLPSQADITDVANAYLDGADAIQLCIETAVSPNPAHVVKIARRILSMCEVEVKGGFEQ